MRLTPVGSLPTLTLCFLVIAGCSERESRREDGGQSEVSARSWSPEDERSVITAMYRQSNADLRLYGADGYILHFADDVVFMPPKGPLVIGKEAVYDWIGTFLRRVSLNVESLVQDEVEVSGDLAFARIHANGHYVVKATGQKIEFEQTFLDVLRRQPDGHWKIARHAWSSNNYLDSLWDRDLATY